MTLETRTPERTNRRHTIGESSRIEEEETQGNCQTTYMRSLGHINSRGELETNEPIQRVALVVENHPSVHSDHIRTLVWRDELNRWLNPTNASAWSSGSNWSSHIYDSLNEPLDIETTRVNVHVPFSQGQEWFAFSTARVLVQGIARYNREGWLAGLESVEQVDLLDPLDVPARLDEFRGMRDGWYEGGGFAPPHAGLDWLTDRFERYYPSDAPLPYTYPTFEGGVRMEWSYENNAVILEIDLHSHLGEWLWFDRGSDAEYEQGLDLDTNDSWYWMALEIRNKAMSKA